MNGFGLRAHITNTNVGAIGMRTGLVAAFLAITLLWSGLGATPPDAAAASLHRCAPPRSLEGHVFQFRANVKCPLARRVVTARRRPINDSYTVFVSRVRGRRYRCTAKPNDMEGANWRCVNRSGRKRIVRWATGS